MSKSAFTIAENHKILNFRTHLIPQPTFKIAEFIGFWEKYELNQYWWDLAGFRPIYIPDLKTYQI